MKTSKLLPRFVKSIYGLTLLITCMFLASCSKDEIQPASSESASTSSNADATRMAPPKIQPHLSFTSISVTHKPVGTKSPEYSFILYADGLVKYKGIKNVATQGSRSFLISTSALITINNLCKQLDTRKTGETEIKDDAKEVYGYDLALTTVLDVDRVVKAVSDINGLPLHTAGIRAKIEQAAGVMDLITKGKLPVAEIAE